jgi:hypothetical protein
VEREKRGWELNRRLFWGTRDRALGHVPVAPRMHSGCPERNAYATPDIALDRIISVAPSWSFVYSAKSAPNAMAGARHAKKRNATDDRHRPRLAGRKASVQSLT